MDRFSVSVFLWYATILVVLLKSHAYHSYVVVARFLLAGAGNGQCYPQARK